MSFWPAAWKAWRWVFMRAVEVDRVFNFLLGGSAQETLSSRAHRMRLKGSAYWRGIAYCIDLMFWWQVDAEGRRHCKSSWQHEMLRLGRQPGVGRNGKPCPLWAPLDQ